MKLSRQSKDTIAIAILVIANLAAITYIMAMRTTRQPKRLRLPKLSKRTAINGRQISIAVSEPSLVEIIDGEQTRAISAITTVGRQEPLKPFNWIVIAPDANRLAAELKVSAKNFGRISPQFINMSTSAAKHLVQVNRLGDLWLLYDSKGLLRKDGNFIVGGVSGELAALVDGAPRFSQQLLHVRLNSLNEAGDFNELHAVVKATHRRQGVFLFINQFTTGCATESIVEQFDSSAKRDRNTVFEIVVPRSWHKTDIKSFQADLALAVPVVKDNDSLDATWSKLAARYGEGQMNWFIVALSPTNLITVKVGVDESSRYLSSLS